MIGIELPHFRPGQRRQGQRGPRPEPRLQRLPRAPRLPPAGRGTIHK